MSELTSKNTSKISQILNLLGYVLILILIFALGFFFGYKYLEGTKKETTNSAASLQNTAQSSSQATEVKPVDGVYWIKPGQEPICPSTHQIKGTFSANSGNYYTKENKRYDTIKADICFASEEFARDVTGFVKKF